MLPFPHEVGVSIITHFTDEDTEAWGVVENLSLSQRMSEVGLASWQSGSECSEPSCSLPFEVGVAQASARSPVSAGWKQSWADWDES